MLFQTVAVTEAGTTKGTALFEQSVVVVHSMQDLYEEVY